jgi:hypothetical protein
MAQHLAFTVDTGVQVYFCDPKSPWQRGTNENTNRLLREYFPKGTDLKAISQDELDAVPAQLNGRPRQTLGFKTPSAKFYEGCCNDRLTTHRIQGAGARTSDSGTSIAACRERQKRDEAKPALLPVT